MKTTKGRICGGYTSNNWDVDGDRFAFEYDAFVFSVDTNTKYLPTPTKRFDKRIATNQRGINFGNGILLVTSDNKLNGTNQGRCNVGASNGYDIEGD